MAIILNDNIKINAGKPIDTRYLTTGNTAYISTAAVCAAISVPERYLGLTVLVDTGTTSVEYWFREDVNTLIPKTVDINIPEGNFITGATNLGYFSGTTGVQRLNISSSISYPDYDGYYCSLYNYYYWGTDNKIHIGAPNDGIPKRGYIKNELPVKSWIWNDGGGSNLNSTGWILADGDVTQTIGATPTGYGVYYDNVTCYPFTASTWTTTCSNGGAQATVVALFGSLLTGTTIAIGARPYAYEDENKLHFRTVISDTPNLISVCDDSTFIRLSGTSAILNATNVGTGSQVFAQKTGTTLQFRTLRGSGDTTITTVGNEIIIRASISGQTSITGATNIGYSGGTGIFAGNDNKTMQFRSIVGSGDTVVTQSGDTVIIFTDAGEQTYNLSSPAVVTVGGISGGTELTGFTAFELFELMLVPVVNPTLTAPFVTTSLSVSGSYEVGTSISSLNVCSTYDAGCINPQYPPTACDKRSNGVVGYCFTSTGGQVDGYYTCSTSPAIQTIATYVVSAGTQTWGTCACACNGVQPYNNKGCPYCSPYVSGLTTVSPASITGIYPWFWGKTVSAPTINQALINSYTCKCCGSSTATIYVTNYNASGEYIWFATPAASTTKTKWQGCNNPSNNGTIPDSFMASVCTILINSPDGCGWTCNYKVYVSNYATAINYCMAFCN